MIRFIDLRGCETGYNFAFWDTTRDQFFKFNGRSAWDTSDEFASDFRCECGSILLSRFLNLMPDWANLDFQNFERGEFDIKIRFFNKETGETVDKEKFYVVDYRGCVYEFYDFTGTTSPFFTRRVHDIGWEVLQGETK